jgi:CRISPR system Cascade subunit CasE
VTIQESDVVTAQELQMIRAELDLRSFQRWAGSRQMMSRNAFDEGYAMHCLLTEIFGGLAPKPFRMITPRGRGTRRGVFYGYGSAEAEALREAAAQFTDPLQAHALPGASLESKTMPSTWKAGTRLGFEVLVRPTIRRSKRAATHPGTEWDAFLWEAIRHPKGGMRRSREDVYRDWLREQFERRGGAELDSAGLKSFQRTRVIRRRGSRPIEGPDAVMSGVLTVTDGEVFGKLLARGIGRHRAYGYGMLLLRPPRDS